MGILEKMQNFSVRKDSVPCSYPFVFDTTKPSGAFLRKVHDNGFKLFDILYKRKSDTCLISEEGYAILSDREKEDYERVIKFTELHDVLTTSGNNVINAIAGSGKALRDDVKVVTDRGFCAVSSLEVGDKVLGTDGGYHTVLGVYPQGVKDIYLVDGVACCGDHLWAVLSEGRDEFIFSTRELCERIARGERYYYPECDGYEGGFISEDEVFLNVDDFVDWYCDIVYNDSGFIPLDYCLLSLDLRVRLVEGLLSEVPLERLIMDSTFRRIVRSLGRDNMPDVLIGYLGRVEVSEVRRTNTEGGCTCIAVDSEDHLFLTSDFIPTHNTTAMVFKIMYDIVTGESMILKPLPTGSKIPVVNKVWVCTFLRTGALELKEATRSWQAKLGYTDRSDQITFSTLDAEFKRCLNSMGAETPIGSEQVLNRLLCKAIDSCGITRGGSPLSKEDYQILSGVVTYYRGRLDNKRYDHPSCKDYGLTSSILDLLIKQFSSLRRLEGVVDFDDITETLYKYLYTEPNKAIQDYVSSRYNFIYVDEFQDTSQMQYAVLKFYARGKLWINRSGDGGVVQSGDKIVPDGLYTAEETVGKIVVVGDISQCIYSFKGSDSNILAKRFDEDFRPTISALSYNWRCPSNILNPIISSIHKNETSRLQRIVPSKVGGVFKAYELTSYKAMIERLKADLLEDMVENKRVGILCRTNFDGMIPALSLEASGGFDFSISGENMTLSSPLPRKLIGVSSLFTERATSAVKNSLSYFLPYGSGWQLNSLMDTLKMNHLNIWDVDEEDLRYSVPDIYKVVVMLKPYFYDNGVRIRENEVEALKVIYLWLISNTFKGDSAYCESARAYIETLIYIIDSNDFKSVVDFVDEIDYLNDRLNGRIKKKAPIHIATVHEFKGKERDSIIVWNDSENVFPSSKCDLKDREQLEEERRVHYIACTRAKEKERIYTLKGRHGLFFDEMEVKVEHPSVLTTSIRKRGVDDEVDTFIMDDVVGTDGVLFQ